MNLNNIKKNIYLIIPMCSVVLWAIIFLISTFFDPKLTDFKFIYFDFKIWYGAGQQIHRDATKLYSTDYGYDIKMLLIILYILI